jgi:rhomboid family protein
MFPIRDHNPSGLPPFVVYFLLAVNVVIFLLCVGKMNEPASINQFFHNWAILPARITEGARFDTLVTSMFLHGGWMHLIGNMLFLWIFGDNLEDEMGHIPFLLFYVVSGIGAGLVHVASAPYSDVPTVGASGAIAGVMGGYLLLYPKAKVDVLLVLIIYFRIFTVPAFVMLGIWLGFQFIGSVGTDSEQGGVAYWAHTGGFAIGLVFCVPLWLKRGGVKFWNHTKGHPPHPEKEYRYSVSRIPKVMKK